MCAKSDQTHFDEYRDQTRVKHAILEKYLKAYFHILSRAHSEIVYIDGFAGPGEYGPQAAKEPGSPLRALELISSEQKFRGRVRTYFIEPNENYFRQLNQAVSDSHSSAGFGYEPICFNAEFADGVDRVINSLGSSLPPTFLFVDPCGVSGVSMAAIAKVIKFDSCEAFLFFNIEGLRRVVGLERPGQALIELFGSEAAALALHEEIRKLPSVGDREALILTKYCAELHSNCNAKFITPFRIERADRKSTSHYLIHVTKHRKGFRIMKEVMYSESRSDSAQPGLFLEQKSRVGVPLLFDENVDALRKHIVEELKSGPKTAGYFYEELSERPENLYCAPAYKRELLQLEVDGIIEVIDPNTNSVKPAAKRQRSGATTLGGNLIVRLRDRS
jgi:three-Cys-motif partner protein